MYLNIDRYELRSLGFLRTVLLFAWFIANLFLRHRSTKSAWSDIAIPLLNVKLKPLYGDTVETTAWARWVGKVSIPSLSDDSSSQARYFS